MQQQAAGREGGRTGGLAGDVEDKRKAGREGGETSGLSRTAAARRRHGHDDAAVIAATTNIPGRASVRDRIDRAKGIAVRQAIQLKIYTTRSLKRDETAGYIRLLHAGGRLSGYRHVQRRGRRTRKRQKSNGLGYRGESGRRLFRQRQIVSRDKLPARIPRLEAI
jgi:hypothetical protein